MPFTIFSHKNDPQGALALIKEAVPSATIKTGDPTWSAVMKFGGGFLKKSKKLTVNFSQEWHEAPNWPTQINGMQNYFSNFEVDEKVASKIHNLVGSFQLTLATIDEPEITDGDDPRLDILHGLAAHLDGVFFTPGGLLDRGFLPLAAADGTSDPEAQFPFIPVSPVATVSLDETDENFDEEERPLDPPSESRVKNRLFALLAMAARGLLDHNLSLGNKPAYSHESLLNWVSALDLESEFEPNELTILNTPSGDLTQQDCLNSVWRLEGLVVLAWALNIVELPRYDELVSTDELINKLGFNDPEKALVIRENAHLRDQAELQKYSEQIFAFHWRTTDYRVNPKKIDFEKMKDECWFGPLDLSWAEFIDRDIALQGTAISKLAPDQIGAFCSTASERHIASNWLQGHAQIYSEVDAST